MVLLNPFASCLITFMKHMHLFWYVKGHLVLIFIGMRPHCDPSSSGCYLIKVVSSVSQYLSNLKTS